MTLVPIYYPPGICKNTTQYAAGKEQEYVKGRVSGGRYTDCDKVRFVTGYPEKIGGWVTIATTNDVNCSLCEFRDNANNVYLGIGAYGGLYVWNNKVLEDITPLLPLTELFIKNVSTSVVYSSQEITLDFTSPSIRVGDSIKVVGKTIGGIALNTWFKVTSLSIKSMTVIGQNTATSSANITQDITISAIRATSDNVSTTVGSTSVCINTKITGISVGDIITVEDTYSIGGLSLAGKYKIKNIGPNYVEFDAPTKAQATVSSTNPLTFTIGVTAQDSVDTDGSYGNGAYGVGMFGRQTNAKGYPGIGWILQPYGQQLLAAPIGGKIYVYDPTIGGRATPLLNAPNAVQAFVVTPERYVIALGINNNFLEIAWPDQDDYTEWTTTLTNTANQGRTLQGGSTFICGMSTRNGTTLLFTDKSVFQASYVAGTYIYNTPMLADNTGIVGPNAKASIGDVIFWMGQTDFWTYNGSVSALPSDDIRAYVFDDINQKMIWKCCAGTFLDNKEVWFFYPSANSNVCDKYVIYHTDQQCWSVGTLTRSAWCHDNLFIKPFASDETGALYIQETDKDADGSVIPWFIETSDSDISDGNTNFDIFGFVPDFGRLVGDARLIVNTSFYPLQPLASDGPFTINAEAANQRLDFRCDGKLFNLRFSGESIGCDFRIGVCRIDYQVSGARR